MGFAEDDRTVVMTIAVEHLGPQVAAAWSGLLRPALRLVPAAGRDGAVVARLGGSPCLGPEHAWPGSDRDRPVAYVGELSCDVISSLGAGVPVPDSGRLLFFFSDDSDFSAHDVYPAVDDVWRTAVLHVSGTAGGRPTPTPPGLPTLPETEWVAVPIWTAPSDEDPALERLLRSADTDDDAWRSHPVRSLDFFVALHSRFAPDEHQVHQVGGWAMPIQGPVEEDARWQALNRAATRGEPLPEPGSDLALILQLDGDAVSGDTGLDLGMLYWLAEPAELALGGTSSVSFVWQTT